MDHFDERESFAIRSSIIMMELDAISEKLKRVENDINKYIAQQNPIDPQVSPTDHYTPPPETQDMQPPKKRMKHSAI
jgi:hypothetical protein